MSVSIGCEKDRHSAVTAMDSDLYSLAPNLLGGLKAVIATGQQVLVTENIQGRERIARPHPLRIMLDGRGITGLARLDGGVLMNRGDRQRPYSWSLVSLWVGVSVGTALAIAAGLGAALVGIAAVFAAIAMLIVAVIVTASRHQTVLHAVGSRGIRLPHKKHGLSAWTVSPRPSY